MRDLDELAIWLSLEATGTASPFRLPGQPFPSHCSYDDATASCTVSEQPELLGECPSQRRVLHDHPVEFSMPRHGELNTHPEAVQGRVPAPYEAKCRQHRAHGTQPVVVLSGLERDVVAEPLGLLVRVGMAARH